MPLVMTKNAVVKCPHGGTGVNIPSQNKVYVNGSPVMVDGDRGIIPDCLFPSIGGPHCTSYELNSMNLNSTFIDGKNVMLVTDVVLSKTGFPLIINETHFVEDNTTPAPIKTGEKTTIPPFLLNLIKPIVTVVPPSYSFSLSTVPPITPFLFTLMSDYPYKWRLTELKKETPNDIIKDLTENLMVNPKGGEWRDKTFKIQLNIPKNELSVGQYFFTLTAVDQRGNAYYAQASVTITPSP